MSGVGWGEVSRRFWEEVAAAGVARPEARTPTAPRASQDSARHTAMAYPLVLPTAVSSSILSHGLALMVDAADDATVQVAPEIARGRSRAFQRHLRGHQAGKKISEPRAVGQQLGHRHLPDVSGQPIVRRRDSEIRPKITVKAPGVGSEAEALQGKKTSLPVGVGLYASEAE